MSTKMGPGLTVALPNDEAPERRRRPSRGRLHYRLILGGILVLACSVVPALSATAGASGGPTLAPAAYTFSVTGGTTFSFPVSVQILYAPEPSPITVTVTPDSSYPGAIPGGLTILDVPAQPNWNCSASNIPLQVVSCTYLPTVPLQPNIWITLNVDATVPVSSTLYYVVADAGATDGTAGFALQPIDLIAVDPASPTSKTQCKDGGWTGSVDGHGQPFKNQGDCVSFVENGK